MARILIIEDNTLISRMYEKAFKFEGYEVDLANNGEAGWEALTKNLPTIILLDVMMPKKSGIDLLGEIKANDRFNSVPVIVLTNLSGTQDAEKALELGAVKFIVKSEFKPKEVVSQVKEILAAYTRDVVPETHKS